MTEKADEKLPTESEQKAEKLYNQYKHMVRI